MKKCPYCAEDIQDTAKKCKHCGEWLDGSKKDTGKSPIDDGSAIARGITKGLKMKQQHDFNMTIYGFLAILLSCLIGSASSNAWIGFGVFVVCMIFITRKYYRE